MPTAWVDFKAVKKSVSMEMVLTRYGVQLRRISRDCLRGRCPLPTHQSRSSSQSFILNTAKDVWSCQSTSCIAARDGRVGGNVLDFVAVMESCSIRDAALRLQQSTCPADAGPRPPQPSGAGLPSSTRRTSSEFKPLAFRLAGVDSRHPYFADRGVTPETARLFGSGYYAGNGCMKDRIAFPIHSVDGVLAGYAGRNLGVDEPRYKFPSGFRKSLFLFNLHRAIQCPPPRTAVVVEGFFDCMKVHEAGHPCVVALMGSSLSSHQADLLPPYFTEVILMLDGDGTGRAATAAIATHLRPRLAVRIAHVPLGRQPDQLSASEIQYLIDLAS